MSSNIFVLESLDGFLDTFRFIQPGRKRVDWTLKIAENLGEKEAGDFLPVIHLPVGFHQAVFRRASWGFLHAGISDVREQSKHIHAEVETLLQQEALQRAVYQASERCLIALSGFYMVWEGTCYRISPVDAPGFMVAGVMSPWLKKEEIIYTFAMITVPASPELALYDDRMPATLDALSAWRWISEKNPGKALSMLVSAPSIKVRIEEESVLDEQDIARIVRQANS